MSNLFGSGAAASSATSNAQGDISKDVALADPPTDSISAVSFSPQSEHLAVSSWDKKVRIYEINPSGQSEGRALFDHEAPVLDCCWSPVRHCLPSSARRCYELQLIVLRMEKRSSVLVQIRLPAC